MKGQCVCGETTFEVELSNHDVHACHCSICRRQTSGVIMTIDVKQGSLNFFKTRLFLYLQFIGLGRAWVL